MGFRLGPWRTHSSESTCCCMLLVLLLALQACSRSTALSAAAYKKQVGTIAHDVVGGTAGPMACHVWLVQSSAASA